MAEPHIAFMAKGPVKPEPLTIQIRQPHLQNLNHNNNLSQRNSPPSGNSISPLSDITLSRYLSPVSTFSHRALLHLENVALENRSRSRSRSTSTSNSATSNSTNSSASDILDYYDTASSCYSRRSSLTSMNSESGCCAYTSADAFSIASPAAVGVFDEPVKSNQTRCSKSSKSSKHSPVELNKPLPHEPPIALAPLQVRKRQTSARSRIPIPVQDQGLALRPTLAQAEQDLQNALDACASQAINGTSTDDVTTATALLNAPLQISRGWRMTPSRPAPRPPPTLSYSQRQRQQQQQQSSSWKTKTGIRKMPFHLTVPGLGRKLHLRSFSSSHIRDLGDGPHDDNSTKNKEEKRPSSVGSERDMPMQLSPLQTKKPEAGNLNGALAAVTAAATASTVNPFSFQLKGSQSSISVGSASTSESGGGSSASESGGPVKSPDYEEKIFVSCSKMPSHYYQDQPDIYELDSNTPPIRVDNMDAKALATKTTSIPITNTTKQTPWDMPDKAVQSILEHAGSLDDLFGMAVVNRQFYRVFKQHGLSLIKKAVFQMSPAAWELREMSPPWDSEWQGLLDPDARVPDYTPTLYLQRYAHDIFTLAQLKSLILARCCSFLRPDTIRGLAGVDPDRATAMDDAFWRVWTFCRIFGCGKGRENDIAGQMDWMNGGVQARSQDPMMALSITEPFGMNNVLFEPPAGFAQGNLGGLSQSQMYDMTELFTCLSVLLQPIHGNCAEARAAGIYNGFDLKAGDNDKEEKTLGMSLPLYPRACLYPCYPRMLTRTEEWTAYILTLGLSAVLSLGSICPIKDATPTFQKAQSMGLTKWDLSDSEVTRSSFLKDAVSKTYKSREAAAAGGRTSISSSPSSSRTSLAITTQETTKPTPDQPAKEHRLRQAAFAAELRNQRSQPRMNAHCASFSEERPISSYTVVMDGLDGVQSPPLPVPSIRLQPARWSSPSSPSTPALGHDPVDRAIDIMVRELGFLDSEAKWALRTTDTGEGVDFNAAVALLLRERESGLASGRLSSSARGLGAIREDGGS